MTIDALVEDPSLRTKYLAGRTGGARRVTWAHTCELPDPWNWLGTGDLLLTDGYAFPADPEAQITFISCLAAADIAGIALAEGLMAPKLTAAAAEHADRLGFAILETEYNIPFVSVARAVAAGNAEAASARLVRAHRLYNILRRSHSVEGGMDELLDLLSAEVRTEVRVLNVRTGDAYLPSSTPVVDELRDAVVAVVRGSSDKLPAFSRVTVDDTTYIVLPVGTGSRAVLVVSSQATDGSTPDLALLQHAATIADVEVERRAALETRKRVRGTRLFQQLVEGTVSSDFALSELSELDLGEGPWRVVLWSCAARSGDLEGLLFDAGVPLLHLRQEYGHLVFVASRTPDEAFANLIQSVNANSGASRLIHNLARVPDGVREARWAMEVVSERPGRRAVYGDRVAPFFPRSLAEAEELVAQILGVLLAYDDAHDSELVKSLEVFFATNRSWQEGARQLGIHRQTLVYRMRRIEALTHRDLNKFGDQAELYFAIRTWRMLQSS